MSLFSDLMAAAEPALGTPYVWGGNDLRSGVDCSGFIQQVYAAAGVALPRVSNQQATAGQAVTQDEAQPGDLVWWDLGSRNDGADHVGIYLGNGKVMEASSSRGQVVIRNLWGEAHFTRVSDQAGSATGGSPTGRPAPQGSASAVQVLGGQTPSDALNPYAGFGNEEQGERGLDFDLEALWARADESDPGEDPESVGPYGVAAMMLRRQQSGGGVGFRPVRPSMPGLTRTGPTSPPPSDGMTPGQRRVLNG